VNAFTAAGLADRPLSVVSGPAVLRAAGAMSAFSLRSQA
jgi:hypothetical protein